MSRTSPACRHGYSPLVKRTMDLTLSAIGGLLLLPFLGLVALLLLVLQGRPILFRQQRAGIGLSRFEMLKFRSMSGGAGADEQRLTRVGRLLRATSIDELPQIWNVLRGDMSLVGPRPTMPHYVDRMSPEQRRRQLIRPGITCLANVRGRNRLSWQDRFAFDVWYVDHRTFWLDITILARTLTEVLRRKGISQPGHATSREFAGNGRDS